MIVRLIIPCILIAFVASYDSKFLEEMKRQREQLESMYPNFRHTPSKSMPNEQCDQYTLLNESNGLIDTSLLYREVFTNDERVEHIKHSRKQRSASDLIVLKSEDSPDSNEMVSELDRSNF